MHKPTITGKLAAHQTLISRLDHETPIIMAISNYHPISADSLISMQPWLLDKASLTARLRQYIPQLRFQLLYAKELIPYTIETQALNIAPNTPCWCRIIRFMSGATTLLFSRVIIPPQTLQSSDDCLTKLGAQPLGDILFSKPDMQRQQITISQLQRPHPFINLAERYIVPSLPTLLVRESICYYQQQPILINDMFMPAMNNFILCQ